MIEFKKLQVKINMKLPPKLKKIGKEQYKTEIRFHPLLEWFWSAVSVTRSTYKPFKVPEDILDQLFTPRVHYFKNPSEDTPEFPEWGGRLTRNEAVIFPNLFSWADIAVCRITEEESIYLKDISIQQLSDALELCQEYFRKKAESSKNDFYPTINMNFLRPAASSVLHPHLQTLCSPVPNPFLYQMLISSEEYLEDNKTNFYLDYVKEEEKIGKRWIGKQGSSNFMTSFCPIGGSDEIFFISDLECSFPLRKLEYTVDIATGLHKIFAAYHEMNIFSINMTIFSQKFNEQSDFFRLCGFIWSRPLRNLDVSDRGFAEIGYKIALSFTSPQELAKKIRASW